MDGRRVFFPGSAELARLDLLVDAEHDAEQRLRFLRRIAPTGTLCATSLRRIDWNRIGFSTWTASTIHLIAGFQ